MASRATAPDGPSLSDPESTLNTVVPSKDCSPVRLPDEKGAGPEESPQQTDSPGEAEFKEGGYGWLVPLSTKHPLPKPSVAWPLCVYSRSDMAYRVVVLSVLLVNAHTWGLNSSYAVFLAYYLRTGTVVGSSPLAFAFIGGLSISLCRYSPPT